MATGGTENVAAQKDRLASGFDRQLIGPESFRIGG